MLEPLYLISLIVFLPALVAIGIGLFVPGNQHDWLRYITLAATGVVLALCLSGFFIADQTQFDVAADSMQDSFNLPWIPSFNIYYFMGVDGISLPLVLLTALICVLAMAASWSITKYVKAYCILFLLLETGMLGVFFALDFFLFYVFWEVMLLPMYFLIGVWGGPRREYAALKFFLYTLFGSVLMLIAILLLYFHSDLRKVAAVSDLHRTSERAAVEWQRLRISPRVDRRIGHVFTGPAGALELLRTGTAASKPLELQLLPPTASPDLESTRAVYDIDANVVTVMLHEEQQTVQDVVAAIEANERARWVVRAFVTEGRFGSGVVDIRSDSLVGERAIPAVGQPVHTFNLLALAAVGQHTDCFDRALLFGVSLQVWAFLLLFVGFVIKVPSVPLHTWLPDAHVEAPTPISMILAGVLLKMGGYGIIRICYPICPGGGYELAYFVCLVGVVSMVYGAFAALAQTDFKRMVAYSSVSHMGYVVLGLGVWSARDYAMYNSDYWNMGVQGAMFQMIAHGISSAGMFFMVGVIYDRVHHRDLNQFGGLFGKMPVYTALSIGIFFAALGLPGLCGFVGEVLVVLSVFKFNVALAVISASVVILTAAYILWAVQRVYLGSEYHGPHEEMITRSTPRENTIGAVLFVLAILLGVLPYQTVLRYMDKTIERQVDDLTEWTWRVKESPALTDAEGESSPERAGQAAAWGDERPRIDPPSNGEDDTFALQGLTADPYGEREWNAPASTGAEALAREPTALRQGS